MPTSSKGKGPQTARGGRRGMPRRAGQAMWSTRETAAPARSPAPPPPPAPAAAAPADPSRRDMQTA